MHSVQGHRDASAELLLFLGCVRSIVHSQRRVHFNETLHKVSIFIPISWRKTGGFNEAGALFVLHHEHVSACTEKQRPVRRLHAEQLSMPSGLNPKRRQLHQCSRCFTKFRVCGFRREKPGLCVGIGPADRAGLMLSKAVISQSEQVPLSLKVRRLSSELRGG